MKKKLIRNFTSTDNTDLQDLIMILAKNIEESMIQAGAQPEKDYSILDLYKLAQPFALEVFKNKGVNYTVSWPSDKDD